MKKDPRERWIEYHDLLISIVSEGDCVGDKLSDTFSMELNFFSLSIAKILHCMVEKTDRDKMLKEYLRVIELAIQHHWKFFDEAQ